MNFDDFFSFHEKLFFILFIEGVDLKWRLETSIDNYHLEYICKRLWKSTIIHLYECLSLWEDLL